MWGANLKDNQCSKQKEPISFMEFAKKLETPDYSIWFRGLQKELTSLSHSKQSSFRLKEIQHNLIDLINSIDGKSEVGSIFKDHMSKVF